MTGTTAALGAAFLLLGSLRLFMAWRSRTWVIGERNGTTVVVRRSGRFLELVLERDGKSLVQSRQDKTNPLSAGPGYVDGLHLGMLLEPRAEHVLFLGGGACIGPRQFEAAYPEMSIDVVENEPLVIAAANRHFGFRITKQVSVHASDARKFVKEATFGPYDLIVVDVYDAQGMPGPLRAPEFFASLRGALADTGAVVVNLIASAADAQASIVEAFPEHELAVFDVDRDNVIVLVAPKIPSTETLIERAAKISVAPFLPGIVRQRR